MPSLVKRWGLQGRVKFTGRVSTRELVRLYNSAEILVSPSVYEGFGLPAAEAQACGTAVVSTTAGALPEVVAHGETGWLVPPGDAAALAGAIKRLMSDAELRAKMGEAGRRRMVERFTWRETARKTVALYEEVLAFARQAGRSGLPVTRPQRLVVEPRLARQAWPAPVVPGDLC